jgi:tetratricopeptide (TPR) repeat protein
MYDRFKTRKRNSGIYKVVVALAVISGVLFVGFRYQRYLTFWKYNQNMLYKKIEASRHIADRQDRREALIGITDTMDRYKEEHQTDSAAFLMSGEAHYLLGESNLAGTFSELFINDKLGDVSKNAKIEFLRAIKDIKKGSALDNGALDENFCLLLSKSCYFAGYNTPSEIFRIIQKSGDPVKFNDTENVRFYSVVSIINKKEDFGLKLLSQHGMVRDNIQGLLFYSTAERVAEKYTGAIVSYKNVLAMTTDEKIRKLVHVNLGKIYFKKSLFKESLEQFAIALKIDERDALSKIWIGKNYSAMGQKDKARAIWSEVLTSDGANTEARELLGTM